MEFLFTNQVASIEALIVFACILLLAGIFGYDLYLYVRQVWLVFFPKRLPVDVELPLSDTNSIAPVIGIDAIEPIPVISDVPEVILDNPVLYTEEWEAIGPESHEEDTLLNNADEPITYDDTDAIGKDIPHTENIDSIQLSPSLPETNSLVENDTEVGDAHDAQVEEVSVLPIIESAPISQKSEPIESATVESLEPTKEKKISHHRGDKKDHTDAVHHVWKKAHTLSPAKREKLTEVINNVRTLIARWQIDEARTLIISGLALEKNNRELNIIMASIYEREHAFEKAEMVLKDIALEYPEDIDILTHLATDLAMQHKYEVSYEIYKKILAIGWEKEEILYTLTHLAAEMQWQDDVLEYARAYLKQYPHNPEILWLYSQAQIANNLRKDAVETLIKLKNLTPYNQEIADLIQKLVTEEELAGNFWGEKA